MTEPGYLLDTNILVYLVGGRSDRLLARVECEAPGVVVTSVLCVAEALYGLGDDEEARAALAELLSVVKPLPFDVEAARAFAAAPLWPGRFNRLIAAHALSLGLVIVTNNERDFADVPDLRVENWTKV